MNSMKNNEITAFPEAMGRKTISTIGAWWKKPVAVEGAEHMPRWKLILLFAGIILCFLAAGWMQTKDLEDLERR